VSTRITSLQERMRQNIGEKMKKVFFIHDKNGATSHEGVVHSVTSANRYHIEYTDNDKMDLSRKDFKKFSQPTATQASAIVAQATTTGIKPPQCKCASIGSCLHPWRSNKTNKKGSQDNVRIATSVKVEGKAKNDIHQASLDPPGMKAFAAISSAYETKHLGPKLSYTRSRSAVNRSMKRVKALVQPRARQRLVRIYHDRSPEPTTI